MDRFRRTLSRAGVLALLAALAVAVQPPPGTAAATSAAIVNSTGCTQNALPRNDDGSTAFVPLPFGLNFFGRTYDHAYVNNNGNITFDAPLPTYTPFGLSDTTRAIIAPFFADVDTRPSGTTPVAYGWGTTTLFTHRVFCVDWINVGYYNQHADKLNRFQLLLVEREDSAPGDFDIYFNYGSLLWETGDASGGSGGLGGSAARAGFSNGTQLGMFGTPGTFEMPRSGVPGAFLDSNPNGLARTSTNSTVAGRHIFQVRSGGAPLTEYVALGDSYQSGVGTNNYYPATATPGVNQCHRSPDAYPVRLVANGEVNLHLDFLACSGSVIATLSDDRVNTAEPPWNDPQDGRSALDHLTRATKLVTVGIGGNDMDFAGILQQCIAGGWVTAQCSDSQAQHVQDLFTAISTKGTDGFNALQRTYAEIRRRAPFARVLVLGYPRFFVPNGATDSINGRCAGVPVKDQRWANAKIAEFDDLIATSAKSMGVEYVDLYDAPTGHELCGPSSQTFINGVIVSPSVIESFHPTAYGHSVIEAKIVAALGAAPPIPTFPILPNQTITKTFSVAAGTAAVTFTTRWPGSDVRLTLKSPGGRVIDRTVSAIDVQHLLGPVSETYTVTAPQAGTWTVQLYGLQVAVEGEPVTLDVWQQPKPNLLPKIKFTEGRDGRTVTVDATGTADPDGTIANYTWDFGDGTIVQTAKAAHRYATAGSYRPALVVTDNRGGRSFADAPVVTVTPYSLYYGVQGITQMTVTPVPVTGVDLNFGLGAYQGTDLFASGYPYSEQITCDLVSYVPPNTHVPATGTLTYTASRTNYEYTYHWKPSAAWRGTCRLLFLYFNDAGPDGAPLGPAWASVFYFQ